MSNHHQDHELNDPILASALTSFRDSVHAWSDAAYHRPRTAPAPSQIAWRRSLAWVLGLALSTGVAGTAYVQHHHSVVARQQEQQREQMRQRQLAQQKSLESEELMANIDNDISREVPAAMEPLAQLMTDDQ